MTIFVELNSTKIVLNASDRQLTPAMLGSEILATSSVFSQSLSTYYELLSASQARLRIQIGCQRSYLNLNVGF